MTQFVYAIESLSIWFGRAFGWWFDVDYKAIGACRGADLLVNPTANY